MEKIKVLIACEESQEVCKAFRELGHEAFSCDILPCSGGHPEWHIQDDVLKHLDEKWDLMIAFPPCTHLAVSGARWFKNKKKEQWESIEFFMNLWNANIPKIAIENPIGVISTKMMKPTQIIQPWMFGHPETKATCLWLKNLPKLEPTNIVEGREQRIWKMGPSPTRWMDRSRTYQGLSDAMADQWGIDHQPKD